MKRFPLLTTFILATFIGGVRMGGETSALVDAVETETSSVTDDVGGLDVNIITRCTRKNCSYRGLKLDNELQVMLISTSAAQKSAATMVLRVGALNDFEELPGIANLVGESVMRLGSETYPQNEFVDFIRANNGKLVGPETTGDQQLFGFEVDADNLRPTLERFVQLFIEPRILSDISKTMLTMIVEEVTKDEASTWDIRSRIQLAERTLGDENHAFNHSVVGDRETFYRYLREEDGSGQHALPWGDTQGSGRTQLHDKLRSFFTKWYSSNLMSLAVIGNENLDELEQMVVSFFKNVENRGAEKLSFPSEQHPWQNHLKRKITSENEPERIVRLAFPAPDTLHQYRITPEFYVSELINREGPGSLYTVLEERKLCNRLEAQYKVEAGIGFFAITCYVHKSNIDIREDDIVELVFQYMNLMREKGIQEWILAENERLNEIKCSATQYDEQFSPLEYVRTIASSMHNYSVEESLSFGFSKEGQNLSDIEQFFNYLVPEKMNVLVFDKKNVSNRNTTSSDQHYKFETISEELIRKWKTVEPSTEFSLPTSNQFIPENVNIHSLETNTSTTDPRTIGNSQKSKIWFKQDDKNPKLSVKFNILNPTTSTQPSSATLLCITSQLLNYMLREYEYLARKAGYKWQIVSKDNYLHVDLSGFAEKIPIILRMITSKLAKNQFEGDQPALKEQFEIAKKKCIMKMVNYQKEDTPSLVVLYLKHILLIKTAESWYLTDVINAAERLQYNEVKRFLTKLHLRMYVQGLIYGNCTEKMALEIGEIIETTFKPGRAILPQEMLSQIVIIEEGMHFVSDLFSKNPEQIYHYYTYYQFGPETSQNRVISSLLLRIIENKCTKAPTDTDRNISTVRAGIFRIQNIVGLLLSAKSSRPIQPISMDSDIENCLKDVCVSD